MKNNKLINWSLLVVILMALYSFNSVVNTNQSEYKCMVQLRNYVGEGAYCTVSLLDSDNKYIKTLYVLGEEEQWYPDIIEWNAFQESEQSNAIDGITGASILNGKRAIFKLKIPNEYVDGDYKLRFETAVEDQEYHTEDVVIPLSAASKGKYNGSGYIRYVRLLES